MNVIELDPLNVTLHGSKLIEASAGTGKTYTITTLYLRALLGINGSDDCVHCKPLSVDEILVVTFTEAATGELKSRIRQRIREARLGLIRGHSEDPTLSSLFELIENHDAAIRLLTIAERQIDTASIFTIHGYCHKMLKDNAFESASPFKKELLPDLTEIYTKIIQQFWREHFYGDNSALPKAIRKHWAEPQDLLKAIQSHLSGEPVEILCEIDASLTFDQYMQGEYDRINQLKALINATPKSDLENVITQSGVSKQSYSKRTLPSYLHAIYSWAESETTSLDAPPQLNKLCSLTLKEKTKGDRAPDHPIFSAITSHLSVTVSLKEFTILKAIEWCREALNQDKMDGGWISFDDLLVNLRDALHRETGHALACKLRETYPLAMIDEFQDTDPIQYDIFSSIYTKKPEGHDERNTAMLLIGDPKQAIYAFRGGDIFTYIKAKREVDEILTLSKNYRSSYEVVNAVNDIFHSSDHPFIYSDDIPYVTATSKAEPDEMRLLRNAEVVPALTLYKSENPEPTTITDYREKMTEACASEIHLLLQQIQKGEAFFTKASKEKAISAKDVAVLVRSGFEADLMKRALAKRGIPSIYLSAQNSVYSTDVAKDLRRLLAAILEPKNEHLIRGCLASRIMGVTNQELETLNTSHDQWDTLVLEFMDYHKTWQYQGVLPLITRVVERRGLASKLLALPDGQRVMTDLFHLGELLQTASQIIDSEHALLKYLSDKIDHPKANEVEQQQRLESQDDLIQIITIHKSKGLEYGIVFMPYVSATRELEDIIFHDKETLEKKQDFNLNPEHIQLALKESLAEDLRLLYVGLTRAVYALYLGVESIKGKTKDSTTSHMNGFGYLVGNGKELSAPDLLTSIDVLSDDSDYIARTLPQELELPRLRHSIGSGVQPSARQLTAHIEKDWWITSYSHLVSGNHHGATYDEAAVDASAFEPKTKDIAHEDEELNIFSFPRGADPGTFLHSIFEEVEYTEPATTEGNQKAIIELQEQYGIDEKWLPVLTELVDITTDCALSESGMKLNQIPAQDRLVEMEFLLPIHNFNARRLTALLAKHEPLWGDASIEFKDVSGLLKGFIDLTFIHEGKFYVLDWKSNYLGDTRDDYHQDAMKEAMADHRYDLQCNLYMLALHRFLKARLPDYSYEKHVGGAYYVFLRGLEDGTDNGIYFHKPDEELVVGLESLIEEPNSI